MTADNHPAPTAEEWERGCMEGLRRDDEARWIREETEPSDD